MVLTVEQLEELLKSKTDYATRTIDQTTYRIGNNAAIFVERPKPSPDYRVPTPYIRRAVELKRGYFARPGNITFKSLPKELAKDFDRNNEGLKTAKMFEGSLTYGRSFELHWYKEMVGAMFAPIPIGQSCPIYSDDLEPIMLGFIWKRTLGNGDDVATHYDDTHYTEFVKAKGKDEWTVNPEKSGTHLYGAVPVLEAYTNTERLNCFDHVLPLVDLHDRILSQDVANELHRFAHAYLLLSDKLDDVSVDDQGRTQLDKIKELGLFEGLGENVKNSIAYLERNINGNFIEAVLDRLERLIYEMLNMPNPSDDDFAAASGIAQAWKMLGAKLDAANMEGYFSIFLQARTKLMGNLYANLSKPLKGLDKVTIDFKHTEPSNLLEIAQIVAMLKGILSDETILGLFPATVIPDVKAELKKLDEQNAEREALFDESPGSNGPSTEPNADDESEGA
jgi:SPP1 family phage portal protein